MAADAGRPSGSTVRVHPYSHNTVATRISRDVTHQLGTPEADHTVVAVVPHKYCGVRYLPGQTYHMAQGDILVNATRGLVHPIGVLECDWWGAPGRVLEPESVAAIAMPDGVEPVHSREASPGAMRYVCPGI